MTKTESRWNKVGDYPSEFSNRSTVKSVLDHYITDVEWRIKADKELPEFAFRLAGRIVARRDHGNNIFFDLEDQTGKIQLHAQNDSSEQPNKQQEVFSDVLEADLGDMVGVEGTIGANPRGEPLFRISDWTLLAKALREPPDKFHGITDDGTRYRHRELDLIGNPDGRDIFIARAKIVAEIRMWLNERDYIEIECPVLQNIYGGATANPFVTHHKALGQDYFLSISSELYLKRALVGGFDRVYTVGRCFRNEGISSEHNPEFTNVEFFATCETYETMARMTEELLKHLWNTFSYKFQPDEKDAKLILDRRMGMPASEWPLSRKHSSDKILSEREQTLGHTMKHVDSKLYAEAWEIYAGGMEIASGASDLNDPAEQERNFLSNLTDHDPLDKNYIEAIEQGALPWAGVGIGVDRLVMLLTGKKNIRDVIMFPTLKNKEDPITVNYSP